MVLPDQLHRRRLGSLVALALGNDVAHLLAFDQLVEVGIDEAVFMEIDLAPVRRLNEAVVLKTIEPGDLAVRRHLVALHAARALTRMVLEAAACRIEGIAQSRSEEHTSEEHTSELQSLMRISYAVLCLKKKKTMQL